MNIKKSAQDAVSHRYHGECPRCRGANTCELLTLRHGLRMRCGDCRAVFSLTEYNRYQSAIEPAPDPSGLDFEFFGLPDGL